MPDNFASHEWIDITTRATPGYERELLCRNCLRRAIENKITGVMIFEKTPKDREECPFYSDGTQQFNGVIHTQQPKERHGEEDSNQVG